VRQEPGWWRGRASELNRTTRSARARAWRWAQARAGPRGWRSRSWPGISDGSRRSCRGRVDSGRRARSTLDSPCFVTASSGAVGSRSGDSVAVIRTRAEGSIRHL